MLDNFIFSVNAVLPIFIIIFLGYFLRRKNILSGHTIEEMNTVVFNIALPLMVFNDMYQVDFAVMVDPMLIVWAVMGTTLCFFLCWIFAEFYLKSKPNLISAFVQGSFRGNYVILGLPLIANIMGDAYTGRGVFIVPFVGISYNILSVLVLSVKNYEKGVIKQTLLGICKNPIIIGICCGIAVSFLPFYLPKALTKSVDYMGALCTPMALLAVGGSISIIKRPQNIRHAIVASLLKTLIMPLIFVPLSIFAFGFREEALVVLYVMFSIPTAVSSYIMAAKMNADAALASNILIFTTIFSVFTFTVGIYVLKSMGLI